MIAAERIVSLSKGATNNQQRKLVFEVWGRLHPVSQNVIDKLTREVFILTCRANKTADEIALTYVDLVLRASDKMRSAAAKALYEGAFGDDDLKSKVEKKLLESGLATKRSRFLRGKSSRSRSDRGWFLRIRRQRLQ